ncbi:MAG: PspC domain-containing protein [Bulleidia sp.]
MERRLYKSQTDRMISGVCGGVAEYFDVDSTLIRLGLAAFCLLGGSGVVAYIAAMIIIPERRDLKDPYGND